MKWLGLFLLVTVLTCQLGRSQESHRFQIVRATYGADSQQIDVTAKVQSIINSGGASVSVGNHLFGTDPAFGKIKTLAVQFIFNGATYRSEIREGEPLSFAKASVDQAAAAATTRPKATGNALIPEGTYFLIGSTSVTKDGALIGLHPGTALKALRDNGSTLHVAWGDSQLDVDKKILSNDVNVVRAAVANDQQTQATFAAWVTNERNKAYEEKQRMYEESARQMERTNQDIPAPTTSERPEDKDLITWLLEESQRRQSSNPLDRPAYNQTGPGAPSKFAQEMSRQPYSGNPLDRPAYNKSAARPERKRPILNARDAAHERKVEAERKQREGLERQRDLVTTMMQSTTITSQEYESLRNQLKDLNNEIKGPEFLPPPYRGKAEAKQPHF